jgi:hypothetical protein
VLTPERVVTHDHDLVQKLLVARAPTGQIDMHHWSDGLWPPPLVPEIPLLRGTPSGKEYHGLI